MKTKTSKTPEQLIEMEKKFRKSLLYSNLGFSIILWLLFSFYLHPHFLFTTITIQLSIVVIWYKMFLLSVDRQTCVVENKPVEIPKPTFLSKLLSGNLFNINLFGNGKNNAFKSSINNFVNRLISLIILMIYAFLLMIIMIIISFFIKKLF